MARWVRASGSPATAKQASRNCGVVAVRRWRVAGRSVRRPRRERGRRRRRVRLRRRRAGGGGGRPGEPEPAATEPGTGEGRGGREGKVGADGVEQPADDGLEEERPREHADDRAELGSDEGPEPNADGPEDEPDEGGGDDLGGAAGLLGLLGVAEWLRLRRQRAEAVARSREEASRRRASEERLAIARELHDVVAHNISVINVQANTALHLMDRQPERARSALSTINDVSKQALVELRSVLGVLRQIDEGAPRAPSPGLERLDELAATTRAAGLAVQVEQVGDPIPHPASVDLAAYRIVQEALTNTVRHSGGSRAVVHVEHREAALVIQVDDDGPVRQGTRVDGSGNGIAGMTERAHAVGGTLEAGPTSEGAFRVRAWLPLNGAAR